MNSTNFFIALAIAAATTFTAFAGSPAAADVPDKAIKATVILVHGAFADGMGWQRLIPLLERDGYTVIAVQNPLTSFEDDVATTKRVIDAQKGPVIVVGHSYGGAVITGAATGNANVKALVYVAAFAPAAGEHFNDMLGRFGPSALASSLVPDAAGFLYINREKFRDVFAKDLPPVDASVMAATQKPVNSTIFAASLNNPAWKSIPSWYLVSQEDQVIKPELQRFMAERMNARTSEVKASHVSFISHPEKVAKFINEAANSVK